MFSFYIHVP